MRRHLPAPDAHRRGTLACFDRFAELAGGHPAAAATRSLLARESPTLSPSQADSNSLKYDLYLAPEGWGATVNDRWEGRRLLDDVRVLAARWGHDLAPFDQVAGLLGGDPQLTVSVGLDVGQSVPRLKFYLQEEYWQGSVTGRAGVLAAAQALGCDVPDWLPDRAVGVVTVVLRPGGATGLKAYLGGGTPAEAARGAPGEARALADSMAHVCPQSGGWYYLTVRMDPGEPVRCAINKIYNHSRIGFDRPDLLDAAWAEVGDLFESAGRGPSFVRLREALKAPGVVGVPTASALEGGGRSADVYVGSWARV